MTIAEIKNIMTDMWIKDATVKQKYGLQDGKGFDDQFSAVSLESIYFSIVAALYWALVQLFGLHVSEVNEIIDNKNAHTLRWYAHIAKQFQYGMYLSKDTDQYNNAGKTDEQIAAMRIVSYSAVVEQPEQLDVKVAKNNGENLAPLTTAELAAFKEYMQRVKDAGVRLNIISREADNLFISLTVYYNPLVLDKDGKRIDGTSDTPVADAIRAHLKDMPFNGELVLAYLVDALQNVDGVVIPDLVSCMYKYGNINFQPVNVKYLPLSGYFTISDDNIKIAYTPQSEIYK